MGTVSDIGQSSASQDRALEAGPWQQAQIEAQALWDALDSVAQEHAEQWREATKLLLCDAEDPRDEEARILYARSYLARWYTRVRIEGEA